jgi:FUS-interacting serine-arginine-rich protein 1
MVFSVMVPLYSCRESRGFGFVQYMDPADAADAQYNMDRQVVGGREITVVFAEENRKKPSEMRIKERSSTPSHGGSRAGGGRYSGPGGGGFRRHSPPRSPARRFRSRTRSRTPQLRHHSSREHVEHEVAPHDRTHTPPSPNRSHRGGHESRSPPQRRDHKLSSPRRDRQPGQPRTLSSLPAKRSSSPEGNGLGVHVTEKSWSRSLSPQVKDAPVESVSPE